MAQAYFDSSVLVKRFIFEIDSSRARQLMRRYQVLSSVLAPVEVLSALARRRGSGELNETEYTGVLGAFHNERHRWELLQAHERVLQRAEAVLGASVLRAFDAVHIASGLVLCEDRGRRTPFVTADQRQAVAARILGLDVIAL